VKLVPPKAGSRNYDKRSVLFLGPWHTRTNHACAKRINFFSVKLRANSAHSVST
jgi:hypothetical protein